MQRTVVWEHYHEYWVGKILEGGRLILFKCDISKFASRVHLQSTLV